MEVFKTKIKWDDNGKIEAINDRLRRLIKKCLNGLIRSKL